MVEDNDWRRQGQERYLQGKPLVKQDDYLKVTHFDHDHCEFCGAKFGKEWLTSGYSTLDVYRWICDECFADFCDEFCWKVAVN